ncbi:MAG: MFS transporter [Candidatus Lokiarchaeota archaeon]|nr:MFS transporter [Candidatus Lokiarchaeota archaeon]
MSVTSQVDKRTARTVQATHVLSFLCDVCTGLFVFALSLYTPVLARRIGATGPEQDFWIGLVAMGWGIVYMFSAVLLGKLSDGIGRRKSLLIAMTGFIGVNVFVLAFASHPLHLFFALCGVAFFFGLVFPVLEALISETTECFGQRIHARSLSIFMISWSVGLTIGPLVGGIFVAFLDHLVAFGYLIVHATIIITIVLACISPPEKDRRDSRIPCIVNSADDRIDGFFSGLPRRTFIFLQASILLLPLVFSFCNQIFFSIYPPFGERFVTGGFILNNINPALVVAILTFTLGIGRTLGFLHAGRMGKRHFITAIVLAPLAMMVGCAVIHAARTADMLLPAFLVYGLGTGYAYSIGMILLMELTRTGKGLKAGFYEGIIGGGTLASTLISTFIAQVDPSSPYLLAMIFSMAISAILLLLLAWTRFPRSSNIEQLKE